MPKMTNPNAERPLSVQPEDVERYEGLGWSVVDGPAPQAAPVVEKTAAKKAVTRKSASKKP